METLYFLVTIGTRDKAQGGPHNIEVRIGSIVISAEHILSGAAGEAKLIPLNLTSYAPASCIQREYIDSIYFTEGSDNGLYITQVVVFD